MAWPYGLAASTPFVGIQENGRILHPSMFAAKSVREACGQCSYNPIPSH